MGSLNWEAFNVLPGSKSQNFENLCRAMIRLHFGQYGQFAALKNQPGVEFHLKLSENCPVLGTLPRWYGWQCKVHERTQTGDLKSSSRADIEDSIRKAEKYLPDLTDWVLWTPFTLSKKDQEWFKMLQTKLKLHQWVEADIETYLCGPGLILKNTYFGELILTPKELEQWHREAVQPIKERWLEPVHQSVDAERTIRRMLGEPGAWGQMIAIGQRLNEAADVLSPLAEMTTEFVKACSAFADTLLQFHGILAAGDLEIIQQKLSERKSLVTPQVTAIPRRLRCLNLPIALDATNALDDMRIAQELLNEAEEFLEIGLVAVLAEAGGGKTQMAAQLTAPQRDKPAGILLHGRYLHRGQTLDNLASHFSINGKPLASMEMLLAALNAAGIRSGCRLPVVIDGLNEAENPRDWKDPLASLTEMIKKYPNVLVVCTLRTGEYSRDAQVQRGQQQTSPRESFAVMALPSDARKIEIEGFGGDVQEAIEKYFKHFKINPEDAEIPVEFLSHPLTLRIFCEVTNPKRESEVKVDYFPASLSPLFEKYVENACARISQMTNLSHSYNTDEVKAALYKLGLELWEHKQCEISEASYRKVVSDTDRLWDGSIVNLLAQEGIIFRNPGAMPGEYIITPVYDALGGYIVADSLLTKYASDSTFEWFKAPKVLEAFGGENSHELAADIFRALVALTPRRMHGSQLWQKVPDSFRNAALRFTTELEAVYLDKDTVPALLALLRDNHKERILLFSRLQRTRGTPNYPLNSEFLDSVLREMSVSERDLSWTEWVRGTRSERFNDLRATELRWKEDLTTRTPADRLRAKWIMWFLTSTDHELRDVATRALYWFGRGDPATLFKESVGSLGINDSYVPERMLAASYGVAMARHVDLKDDTFVSSTLPKFARELYDSMFAEGALFGTTHSLMREYASRIVEITSLHNPGLFSPAELQRSRPPFMSGKTYEWGESETAKEERHYLDSPFRMDFENYILGSLVPDRRNYDDTHGGYQKIRAQVRWRVGQLGWSSKLFKDVDSSIEREHDGLRPRRDMFRTDRYGKKYSWIAFYEMSGLLYDQGVLKNCRERTSSVDIDPSFPNRVTKGHIIEADFLGAPEMDMKEWIAKGPPPNIEPYLIMEEVQQTKGPWIALDGFTVQEDETRGRKVFCFVRSFLVTSRDADSCIDYLSRQDLSGRWLPEKPEVIYTFAGEIPWCDSFPANNLSEFSFVTKEELVKVKKTQPEFYLNGEKLGWTQLDLIQRRLLGDSLGENEGQQHISDEDLERIEVRNVQIEAAEVKKEHRKFSVQIPVCDFGWEGYQTAASDAGHATSLAKELALELKLIGQPQTFDLFTTDGIKATYNISDHNSELNNHQSMFFIKESLLTKYLKDKDLVLIWAAWGEREYSLDQIEKLFHGPDRPEQTYGVFNFVKRYDPSGNKA